MSKAERLVKLATTEELHELVKERTKRLGAVKAELARREMRECSVCKISSKEEDWKGHKNTQKCPNCGAWENHPRQVESARRLSNLSSGRLEDRVTALELALEEPYEKMLAEAKAHAEKTLSLDLGKAIFGEDEAHKRQRETVVIVQHGPGVEVEEVYQDHGEHRVIEHGGE